MLANNITPKTLKIKWRGNKFEQAIIRKAESSLVHNKIKYTNIKINHLQTEIAKTKTSLLQKLDGPNCTNLQKTIFSNEEKTFIQCKNTQIKKLKHLSPEPIQQPPKMASKTANTFSTTATSSTTSHFQEIWVINLSEKELTPKEKSLLQKGPKFEATPATIPV